MAVVEERRERCDGCGRTVPLEQLTTVTMPDGERFACCRRCEPHARNAAEKLSALDVDRESCDGCLDAFPPAELDDVVLTDGTVITVCPSCLTEVPGRSDRRADAVADGAAEPAMTTEIARPETLCSQCHERFDVELYHVTTIDGRTEEMCPDCKEQAEAKGVVSDVKMRRAEAREILDVDPGASEREIREAFLTQVKNAHPDRKSGSRQAFSLVKEAYDRLS